MLLVVYIDRNDTIITYIVFRYNLMTFITSIRSDISKIYHINIGYLPVLLIVQPQTISQNLLIFLHKPISIHMWVQDSPNSFHFSQFQSVLVSSRCRPFGTSADNLFYLFQAMGAIVESWILYILKYLMLKAFLNIRC